MRSARDAALLSAWRAAEGPVQPHVPGLLCDVAPTRWRYHLCTGRETGAGGETVPDMQLYSKVQDYIIGRPAVTGNVTRACGRGI